jgi:hypothetical protein
MERSQHRSWFKCQCGHTFRSVTHRRRGLRKCPCCHTQADHRPTVPPNASDQEVIAAQSRVLDAALATAHCWHNGYSWELRQCLDALKAAEHAYRAAAFRETRPTPIQPPPHGWGMVKRQR